MVRVTKLLAACMAAMLFATSVFAQTAAVRVRGTIEKVDGATLTVTSREGEKLTITLPESASVSAVIPASLADIKSGSFVGVAASPMNGGMLRAVEVLIFPEAMRGTGEGHRSWDLMPDSTMTNASVADTVSSANGPVVTLKYKDGEQKVFVPPDAPIVTFANAERTELKPGAKIFIGAATKQADGTLQAARIAVGRGIDPPM